MALPKCDWCNRAANHFFVPTDSHAANCRDLATLFRLPGGIGPHAKLYCMACYRRDMRHNYQDTPEYSMELMKAQLQYREMSYEEFIIWGTLAS